MKIRGASIPKLAEQGSGPCLNDSLGAWGHTVPDHQPAQVDVVRGPNSWCRSSYYSYCKMTLPTAPG